MPLTVYRSLSELHTHSLHLLLKSSLRLWNSVIGLVTLHSLHTRCFNELAFTNESLSIL
jgi:hypothetical protein